MVSPDAPPVAVRRATPANRAARRRPPLLRRHVAPPDWRSDRPRISRHRVNDRWLRARQPLQEPDRRLPVAPPPPTRRPYRPRGKPMRTTRLPSVLAVLALAALLAATVASGATRVGVKKTGKG